MATDQANPLAGHSATAALAESGIQQLPGTASLGSLEANSRMANYQQETGQLLTDNKLFSKCQGPRTEGKTHFYLIWFGSNPMELDGIWSDTGL